MNLFSRTFQPIKPCLKFQTRGYITVSKLTKPEILSITSRLQNEILTTNWADHVALAQNVPFWEDTYTKLRHHSAPYLQDPVLQKDLQMLTSTFNVFYVCEDVRDFINELLEVSSRTSGVLGTGAFAREGVSNIKEAVKHIDDEYQTVLKEYGDYKAKIEQSIGSGLALLRSKHKFNFSTMNRYSF